MLQTECAGEVLLERGWNLLALFGAERVMRHIQMRQMCGTAAQ